MPLTYSVEIQQADTIFEADLTNCGVTSSTACLIPVATLRASPFNLQDSDSVTARVQSTNSIGDSIDKTVGNGAQIPLTLSTPGAPSNLLRTDNYLDKTQIQLGWAAPTNTGNTAIIDYRIEYAIGAGSYQELTTGVTSVSHTATSLTPGESYKFKV